jgi:DNA-binding NtrC family response regulator
MVNCGDSASVGYTAVSTETPRILVVEDEFLIRDYVVDQLRDCGFDVMAVGTADEALELIDQGRPVDLVFTDITLPGRNDGLALALSVRSRRPKLPVVLTSGGHNAAKAAEVCKDEPFFAKPYDLAALVDCFRRLLREGKQANQVGKS